LFINVAGICIYLSNELANFRLSLVVVGFYSRQLAQESAVEPRREAHICHGFQYTING